MQDPVWQKCPKTMCYLRLEGATLISLKECVWRIAMTVTLLISHTTLNPLQKIFLLLDRKRGVAFDAHLSGEKNTIDLMIYFPSYLRTVAA